LHHIATQSGCWCTNSPRNGPCDQSSSSVTSDPQRIAGRLTGSISKNSCHFSIKQEICKTPYFELNCILRIEPSAIVPQTLIVFYTLFKLTSI
jgi:hypothetical protein